MIFVCFCETNIVLFTKLYRIQVVLCDNINYFEYKLSSLTTLKPVSEILGIYINETLNFQLFFTWINSYIFLLINK